MYFTTLHQCQLVIKFNTGFLCHFEPKQVESSLSISERNLFFLCQECKSFYHVKNLSELIYLDFKLVQKIKKHGYGTRVLLNCPNCRRCQDKNPLGSRWVSCLIHQESQQCWAFNTEFENQIPLLEMFGFKKLVTLRTIQE